MTDDEAGQRALDHIDQVLRDEPHKNDHALSEATMCLTALRDRLVADGRARGLVGHERRQLLHVNAIITIVLSVHFPLGRVPWDELRKARDWLAQIVCEDALKA